MDQREQEEVKRGQKGPKGANKGNQGLKEANRVQQGPNMAKFTSSLFPIGQSPMGPKFLGAKPHGAKIPRV